MFPWRKTAAFMVGSSLASPAGGGHRSVYGCSIRFGRRCVIYATRDYRRSDNHDDHHTRGCRYSSDALRPIGVDRRHSPTGRDWPELTDSRLTALGTPTSKRSDLAFAGDRL